MSNQNNSLADTDGGKSDSKKCAGMTNAEILAFGKIYASAVPKARIEIVVRIAACPHCGADIDQYCVGQYRKPHPSSLHFKRNEVAAVWRDQNRQEWQTLMNELIVFHFRQLAK